MQKWCTSLKRIISDTSAYEIYENIRGLDKDEAINVIRILKPNIKQSTAERYYRYVRSKYKERLREKRRKREWGAVIEKIPPREKERHGKEKKAYWTHRFYFICKAYKDETVEHFFSYIDESDKHPSLRKARRLHDAKYPHHRVVAIQYISSLKPYYGD